MRDAALRALVFENSAKNPADAFTWALSITDENLRELALSIVAYDWFQSDPEADKAMAELADAVASGSRAPGAAAAEVLAVLTGDDGT